MNSRFIELVKKYLEKVNEVKVIMLKDFEVETKEQLIFQKRLPFEKGEFKVKSENKYRFHGRGCHFLNDDFEIDWNFGYDKIWCGVDPYLFGRYLVTEQGKENSISLYNEMKDELDKLVEKRIMYKKLDLYYFTDDWNASEKH